MLKIKPNIHWSISIVIFVIFSIVEVMDLFLDIPFKPLADLSKQLISAHQFFFHAALFMAILVIFRKDPSNWWFIGVLIVSDIVQNNGLIDFHLYAFLNQNALLPSFLNHNGTINPQYTKLILFMIVFPILLIMCCFKKFRSRQRIFVALIVGACLTTVGIFHSILPGGTFSDYKKSEIEAMYRAIHWMKESSSSNLNLICEMRKYECLQIETDSKMDERIIEKLKTLKDEELEKGVVGFSGSFAVGDFKPFIFGAVKVGDDKFLLKTGDEMILQQRLTEARFSLLGLIANGFWVVLGGALMMWHMRPKKTGLTNQV